VANDIKCTCSARGITPVVPNLKQWLQFYSTRCQDIDQPRVTGEGSLERKHNNISGPWTLPVIRLPKGTKITVSSVTEKDAGLPMFRLMKPLAITVHRVKAVSSCLCTAPWMHVGEWQLPAQITAALHRGERSPSHPGRRLVKAFDIHSPPWKFCISLDYTDVSCRSALSPIRSTYSRSTSCCH